MGLLHLHLRPSLSLSMEYGVRKAERGCLSAGFVLCEEGLAGWLAGFNSVRRVLLDLGGWCYIISFSFYCFSSDDEG